MTHTTQIEKGQTLKITAGSRAIRYQVIGIDHVDETSLVAEHAKTFYLVRTKAGISRHMIERPDGTLELHSRGGRRRTVTSIERVECF